MDIYYALLDLPAEKDEQHIKWFEQLKGQIDITKYQPLHIYLTCKDDTLKILEHAKIIEEKSVPTKNKV